MAQAAAMGPPLSPRETRRSGRRSAPSASASASKSPDSDQPPRDKAASSRGSHSSATIRNSRKPKLEEWEEALDGPYPPSTGVSASGSNNGNNKAKRKTKDKDKGKAFTGNGVEDVDTASADGQAPDLPEEEEEQGITRCVCGSAGESTPHPPYPSDT